MSFDAGSSRDSALLFLNRIFLTASQTCRIIWAEHSPFELKEHIEESGYRLKRWLRWKDAVLVLDVDEANQAAEVSKTLNLTCRS
jgi:hypothetical protein